MICLLGVVNFLPSPSSSSFIFYLRVYFLPFWWTSFLKNKPLRNKTKLQKSLSLRRSANTTHTDIFSDSTVDFIDALTAPLDRLTHFDVDFRRPSLDTSFAISGRFSPGVPGVLTVTNPVEVSRPGNNCSSTLVTHWPRLLQSLKRVTTNFRSDPLKPSAVTQVTLGRRLSPVKRLFTSEGRGLPGVSAIPERVSRRREGAGGDERASGVPKM